MDPKACLDRAESAIADRDFSEAIDALNDYANWRRMGGFEPAGGDARYYALHDRIAARQSA